MTPDYIRESPDYQAGFRDAREGRMNYCPENLPEAYIEGWLDGMPPAVRESLSNTNTYPKGKPC